MWLLVTVTVGMQSWIGDKTIYAKGLEQQREELHFAILTNQAPRGQSWGAVGGQSIQKRVGVVYLAEEIRQVTGLPVGKVYKLLDSIFLLTSLLLLFFYLRRWVSSTYSLVGVLYFCAALPLTYFFQLFHPWDRLQLAIWIALLHFVADRRLMLLAIGLMLGIVVKFDIIVLPFFYFMVHFSAERWQRVSLETAGLLVLGFATYFFIGYLFPAPLDASHFTIGAGLDMLASNWQKLVSMNIRFPPLLVHALPIVLSLFYLGTKNRFVRVSVAFALGLTGIFACFTNYEEVRAHMVVLVLVLPSALLSLRRVLDDA
jgi:hypothetical protein